jgi:acyl-CoA synthetase (AMP-forming)/AMP-acid ligase II
VRHVTSGSLRWGLSAAGHLDAEVFRFFQRNGVELLSGFGMTEATGGITMTPPGGYRDDSLGCALPGIELRVASDGELLVRGPYVMEGYLEPSGGDPGFDGEGWFHTGDLMEQEEDGFLRLVDRKKEIYKNIKGETIAPPARGEPLPRLRVGLPRLPGGGPPGTTTRPALAQPQLLAWWIPGPVPRGAARPTSVPGGSRSTSSSPPTSASWTSPVVDGSWTPSAAS